MVLVGENWLLLEKVLFADIGESLDGVWRK